MCAHTHGQDRARARDGCVAIFPSRPVADVDELEVFALEAELLAEKIQVVALEEGNAILSHAASTARQVASGVRRAIARTEAKTQRQAALRAEHSRDAQEREYDALTKQLAEQRGISYEEMDEIRRGAAARSRKAAGAGTIAEQLERVKPR